MPEYNRFIKRKAEEVYPEEREKKNKKKEKDNENKND